MILLNLMMISMMMKMTLMVSNCLYHNTLDNINKTIFIYS